MECRKFAKDKLYHFTHLHPLSLRHLQPNHKNENVDDGDEDEDENKDENDFMEEDHHVGQCNMCEKQIWSFHLCYYYCESCDYSLHKLCAELPMIEQNHPLHLSHELFIKNPSNNEIKCFVCNGWHDIFYYYCSKCNKGMDIICATTSKQKINHPSHPHQLDLMFGHIVSSCVACGDKHEGEFFQCVTCPSFRISLDCVLLPAQLLIQNHTNGTFTHSHPLILSYSFPESERKARFYPLCRVCDGFFYPDLWLYKCDRCRYYVHVDCATSKREPFMSIFLRASLGKTYKNFKEDEHPNMLQCPFHDEGDNLLRRRMSNQKESISKQHDGEMLNHFSHQHTLILLDEQTSIGVKTISMYDPMKRVKLLCDGCMKPIMTLPFYMCRQYADEQCCFVLHEWCARLPLEVQDYHIHPEHALFLQSKIPSKFFGVFKCAICWLPSNGFAYGCTMCEFYVDINCAFVPEEITHDAHPDHLLSKVIPSAKLSERYCSACDYSMDTSLGFRCPSCEFYIHIECAFLLSKVIKRKFDKHPLSLRYTPAENHISEYFCEICEDEFTPWEWFYHCTTCDQSMHAACAPLILQCEQTTYKDYDRCVYKYLNIKFGGTLEIKGHSHRLTFVQGLESDGACFKCGISLQYKLIFRCLECEFAIHHECASSFVS